MLNGGKNCVIKKKQKVFKPTKNFRYLPGSVSRETNLNDLQKYNSHRYRLFTIRSTMDTTPMPINPHRLFPMSKIAEDIRQCETIDKENKRLLYKINFINRNGGWVDCYNPWAYSRKDDWLSYERKMKQNDKENKMLYKMLLNSESYYSKKDMDKRWENIMEKMSHSCKFPLIITKAVNHDAILKSEPSISSGLNLPQKDTPNRPKCFLEFKVRDGEYLGKVIIQLYFDYVPVTVQNFMELCRGEKLSYKNCLVHRIVRGQFLETGDITLGTGRGGTSIYGKTFREENHVLKHTKAGVVSMKRLPPNENNSQFVITLTKMEQLDHKNVVFGNVVKGFGNLLKIQNYGRKIGKPYVDIIICNCGLL
ncbi:peptidyl-prolyl cis-trans isomerase F, mitochondrial-like [Diorhabda carinulata]|uniref:peptidyl-prolyl cis-trans isomerase F, mitochondrial-like n=1 Tax=Diorhabda carinulata TaxID=1163345 RepID=UPI0025A16E42|nr:peptidyl-prolyl cis-trans isomerase F, mitochondrial-like [Diorhabda carinulata]